MKEYQQEFKITYVNDDIRITSLNRIVCWKLKYFNFTDKIDNYKLDKKAAAVYIFLDQDNKPSYVGQSNNWFVRMNDPKHKIKLESVENIILIFSDKISAPLFKHELRYYEQWLISDFNEKLDKNAKLENIQKNYNKKVDPIDIKKCNYEYEIIKNQIKFLLPNYIDYDDYEILNEKQKSSDHECKIFTKNKEEIDGIFNKNKGSITILPDQEYTLNKYQSSSDIQKKHWDKAQNDLLKQKQDKAVEIIKSSDGDQVIKIKKSIKFNSPSAAACFIHASSRNGRTDWKLPNGEELRTIIDN